MLQDWHDFRDKLIKAGVDPNSESHTIGTWYNEKTGNSEFDLSATVSDLRAALVIGEEYNQEAIYDHLTGGVISYRECSRDRGSRCHPLEREQALWQGKLRQRLQRHSQSSSLS